MPKGVVTSSILVASLELENAGIILDMDNKEICFLKSLLMLHPSINLRNSTVSASHLMLQ